MASAYYDSCVIEASVNEGDPAHLACLNVTTVGRITWKVVVGEASIDEAPIAELLEKFEAYCSLSGIPFRLVTRDEAKAQAKRHQPLKKQLQRLGLSLKDFKHLMGAVDATTDALLSIDPDFFDPAQKRTGGHPSDGPMRKAIRQAVGVSPERPERWLALQRPDR